MISNEVRATFQTVTAALNKYQVDYMLVGGTAVAFYGYQRLSGISFQENPEIKIDHDFWYNPTNKNFINLLKALADLGVDTFDLQIIVFDPQRTFLKILHKTFHTDFLPQMKGLVSFKESKRKCEKILLDESALYIISKEDLLINKKVVNRDIDKRDFDSLR
jgi:hypothetical protein